MVKPARSIDVSETPELARIAEDVRGSGEPCLLRRGDEELAMLVPVGRRLPTRRLKKKKLTAEDIEAFLSSAGGWAGLVDAEKLKADIYASREASYRRMTDDDLPDR
jgi:hypothetical protein